MNADQPEAPEGYIAMLGKDVPFPVPNRTVSRNGDIWIESDFFDQPAVPHFWYAIPAES